MVFSPLIWTAKRYRVYIPYILKKTKTKNSSWQ